MGEYPAWYQRLLDENQELQEKIDNLEAFLVSPKDVPSHLREKHLLNDIHLREQLTHMRSYQKVLEVRIRILYPTQESK